MATFVQEFDAISVRALELAEEKPQHQEELLQIACLADQMRKAAAADMVPFGGSYEPWYQAIADFKQTLNRCALGELG